MTLGGHGDDMVPARSPFDGRRRAAARPGQDGLAREERSTQSSIAPAMAAARSSRCSRPGSAFYARPRRSRWPRSYLKDQKRILPSPRISTANTA